MYIRTIIKPPHIHTHIHTHSLTSRKIHYFILLYELTLVSVVDEHKLHPYVLAVRLLQSPDYLLQRQSRIFPAYPGRPGKIEDLPTASSKLLDVLH